MAGVVAVLAAMPSELRPFARVCGLRRSGATAAGRVAGHRVVATTMGVGMARARAATERALEAGPVDRVVVIGIAGGIDTRLPIGTVVVPEVVVDGTTGAEHHPSPWGSIEPRGRLVTYDDFAAEMADMPELLRRGFTAVDMETAAVAAVCEQRGCPFTVFRAISDDATDGSVDADIAAMARPDGSPDAGAALRYVLRGPWRLPRLVRLGLGARRAAAASAAAAAGALRDGSPGVFP